MTMTMPPLSGGLARMADYYRIRSLPDGFPASERSGSLCIEPIDGVCVSNDYLGQYRQSKAPELADALRVTARQCVKRMEPVGAEGLEFMHEPMSRTAARQFQRYLSDLFQARICRVLPRGLNLIARGLQLTGRKLQANLVLTSLTQRPAQLEISLPYREGGNTLSEADAGKHSPLSSASTRLGCKPIQELRVERGARRATGHTYPCTRAPL